MPEEMRDRSRKVEEWRGGGQGPRAGKGAEPAPGEEGRVGESRSGWGGGGAGGPRAGLAVGREGALRVKRGCGRRRRRRWEKRRGARGEGAKGKKRTERATAWGKGEGNRRCGMPTGARGWEGAGRRGRLSHLGLRPPSLRGSTAANGRAPQFPGSLADPPVLLGRQRRGPGRRGSQRRLLHAGP